MVAAPKDQPLLGSPEKIRLADLDKQFVAYAVARPLGKGELIYVYPGLDYTKFDGGVFKQNLDRHVRTFPANGPSGR
jgi:hypothetical protein